MDLQEELFRIVDTLDTEGIDYALCGGLAVIVHGHPRLTRDIDMLILPEDLDRIRDAVRPLGFSMESGILPFDQGQPTERRVFRVTKAEGHDHLTLDLVLVGSFLDEVWRRREKYKVQGRDLCVVSRDGLATMKRAAGRPQDLEDLRQLGLDDERQ